LYNAAYAAACRARIPFSTLGGSRWPPWSTMPWAGDGRRLCARLHNPEPDGPAQTIICQYHPHPVSGGAQAVPCGACHLDRPRLRPFPESRRPARHFGSCGSCKWRDHATTCAAQGGEDQDKDEEDRL